MPDLAAPPATPDSDFAPRARRSAFKHTSKGALFLQFDRFHVLAVRPWPPRAWKRPVDGREPWKGVCDLSFELNAALREVRTAESIAKGELALERLPPWQRPPRRASARIRRDNLARFFAEMNPLARSVISLDWGSGTWRLYCLLCTSQEARELCSSDEGMRVAWALAQVRWLLWEKAPKRPLAFGRRWVRKKRRDILGRLGFPPTNASLKALCKVPLAHLNIGSAQSLRDVLNHDDARARAQHLPELTRGVLELLREAALRPLVDHAFLLELAALGLHAPDDEPRVLALLRDTARLAEQLQRQLKVFSSVSELQEKHDQLASWAAKLVQATGAPFPPLPIALTAQDLQALTPLTHGVALLEEGRKMGHCLGSLDWQHTMAHAGTMVAFAVHQPARLTLALQQGADGTWRILDFAAPHNQPPPREAHALAHQLLARFNHASAQRELDFWA